MPATMTQALRQLEQLQEIVDSREARTTGPMSEVELARGRIAASPRGVPGYLRGPWCV